MGLVLEAATEHVEVMAVGADGIELALEAEEVGQGHTRRLAPFLEALREHFANTYVEHTGGGCFWISARLEDGRVVAFTEAFKDGEEWLTDAALPEAPEGPWIGVLYKTEDADEALAEQVPLDIAGAASFLAAALPQPAGADEGGEGGSA